MEYSTLKLEPGTLWERIIEQTQHALACHSLQPIPTECQFIAQESIQFLVRVVSNLARKGIAKKKQQDLGQDFNPFLPYETDLFVADLSDTHLCLLNKYNVVDYHLLIITRAFEEQETWLARADFEALAACLLEFDSLAFYNSGKLAGASQRHKHLQLVPLPLTPQGRELPIAPALAAAQFEGRVGTIPLFSYRHALVKLNPACLTSPSAAAQAMLEGYQVLLAAIGRAGWERPAGAYNLLATRQWMLAIPRSQESFASIPVNALGFAGAFLVGNQEQLQLLQKLGPLSVLQQVAEP